MDSLIRWTTKDRQKLDSAINKFNKEVNKMSKMEIEVPEKANYKNLIQHITTRRELDSVLESLRGYNEITATTEVALQSGEKVSLYMYNEVSKKQEQAKRNLHVEMNKIQSDRMQTGNKYMGEERITEIQETIESLQDTFKSKEALKRMQKLLKRQQEGLKTLEELIMNLLKINYLEKIL